MSGQALTFAQIILPNEYCISIRSLVAMVILHFLIYHSGDIVLPLLVLPADPKSFYFCAMFIYKKGTEKCVSLFRFINY